MLHLIVPPPDADAESTVDDPLHKKVPLLLDTVGAAGVPPVLITTVLLLPLVPQLFDWYA